ncbi:MAG TPA: hypothetical protein VIJ85_03850 [Rhizomicrobium sp.]
MRKRSAFLFGLAACLFSSGISAQDFSWPVGRDAVPDEQTAIALSVAIFHGQVSRSNPEEIAKRLEAFRYRTSDDAPDPKGDAWFIQPSEKEQKEFDSRCAGKCLGGCTTWPFPRMTEGFWSSMFRNELDASRARTYFIT